MTGIKQAIQLSNQSDKRERRMTNGFPDLWNKLVNLAQDRSSKSKNAGMAAFFLKYDPYECEFCCEVSWSDNFRIKSVSHSEDEAVRDCIGKLEKEINSESLT